MKHLIYLLLITIFLTSCEETKTVQTVPGWAVTDDLTRSASFSTRILVDPYGRKYLVISGGGVAIIPYSEPVTLEAK